MQVLKVEYKFVWNDWCSYCRFYIIVQTELTSRHMFASKIRDEIMY